MHGVPRIALWTVDGRARRSWVMMTASPNDADLNAQGGPVTTDLPRPTARRLSVPSWKDSRLIIGVLLILSSVVLGALAVGAADDRVGAWAARADMTPGDPVGEDDLVRVEVQLGDGAESYLLAGRELPRDATLDRHVGAGELVPRSALVAPGDVDVRPTTISVDPGDLTHLAKGTRVAVYAAPPLTSQEKQDGAGPSYEKVMDQVTVHSVPSQNGSVIGGGRSTATVTVLVPEEEVADILSLDGGEQPLRVIPAGGVLAGADG